MTPASVPAPGQDNPQERLQQLVDCLPRQTLRDEASKLASALAADLEAATRERDEARKDLLAENVRVIKHKRCAEAAERALEAARDALHRLYEEVTSSWYDNTIHADSSHAQDGVKASTLAKTRDLLDASASTENTP